MSAPEISGPSSALLAATILLRIVVALLPVRSTQIPPPALEVLAYTVQKRMRVEEAEEPLRLVDEMPPPPESLPPLAELCAKVLLVTLSLPTLAMPPHRAAAGTRWMWLRIPSSCMERLASRFIRRLGQRLWSPPTATQ